VIDKESRDEKRDGKRFFKGIVLIFVVINLFFDLPRAFIEAGVDIGITANTKAILNRMVELKRQGMTAEGIANDSNIIKYQEEIAMRQATLDLHNRQVVALKEAIAIQKKELRLGGMTRREIVKNQEVMQLQAELEVAKQAEPWQLTIGRRRFFLIARQFSIYGVLSLFVFTSKGRQMYRFIKNKALQSK
jgi:hypothetical protein